MIMLYAVIGLFTGSCINWAADVLPRFAVDRSSVPPNLRPRFTLALLRPATADRLALATEMIAALLFVYLGWRAPALGDWLWLATACAFFGLVAVIDLKYRLVLNVVMYPALTLALITQVLVVHANLITVLIGAAFGLLIFQVARWLRPDDLGGGDVKLAALIGVIFGFPHVLWALLIGVLAGGAAAIGLLAGRHWKPSAQMPYAPFLCLGAIIALLYNPLAAIFQF
ncbi:MAG: prepilin peptidase [Chloroflexi bacterium]|nr:prepilin peptidase [Chloroflexota bacterium]